MKLILLMINLILLMINLFVDYFITFLLLFATFLKLEYNKQISFYFEFIHYAEQDPCN